MSKKITKNNLAELARKIKAEHKAVLAGVRATLQHARNCGLLLIQAKREAAHGTWYDWVEVCCGFSERPATDYMRVAEHWKLLSDRQHAADLSIRGALKMLSEKKKAETTPAPAPATTPETTPAPATTEPGVVDQAPHPEPGVEDQAPTPAETPATPTPAEDQAPHPEPGVEDQAPHPPTPAPAAPITLELLKENVLAVQSLKLKMREHHLRGMVDNLLLLLVELKITPDQLSRLQPPPKPPEE